MFNAEHLQEKWSPVLNNEAANPIADRYKKAVTSVLLENQEKFLREEAAFSQGINLMESPTNSAGSNPAGFSGAAAAAGLCDRSNCAKTPLVRINIRRRYRLFMRLIFL